MGSLKSGFFVIRIGCNHPPPPNELDVILFYHPAQVINKINAYLFYSTHYPNKLIFITFWIVSTYSISFTRYKILTH